MKRTAMKVLVASAIASTLAILAVPSQARADHRRTSYGVYVGPGGFSFGAAHGPGVYYPRYRSAGYYTPVVVPSCCHYERVFVPATLEPWGGWHPGYYRTYRTCDHHGRVFLY